MSVGIFTSFSQPLFRENIKSITVYEVFKKSFTLQKLFVCEAEESGKVLENATKVEQYDTI